MGSFTSLAIEQMGEGGFVEMRALSRDRDVSELEIALTATRLRSEKDAIGSHYYHILLCWLCIYRYGVTDVAFNAMNDALIQAKDQFGKMSSHSPLQNHLWFGLIAQCYMCDRIGGKLDFITFMGVWRGLCDKRLLSGIRRLSNGGAS